MSEGLNEAISLASQAIATVPAYQKFLKNCGHRITTPLNEEGFLKLPITNKKNYIQLSPLKDSFNQETWPDVAYSSSGSSGTPTFWLRGPNQDEAGGKIHERIFRETFGIKKHESTLVIICFSMGVWVAGNYTLSCCRWVSAQGYKLTTITPGIERHDIFHILKNLAPNFQNVILAGYPSFVMDILTETKNNKIPVPKNLSIITAGDSFSEQWRESALKLMGNTSNPSSIISIYGSADAGVMGFETPLSITLRRIAEKNGSFSAELFGNAEKQPAFVQFDPKHIFIESQNGELLLTAHTSIPLIRYNIHDTGKVVSFNEIKKLLEKYNLSSEIKKYLNTNSVMPFLIKYGRTDVAVTFYALNIYPEHIQQGLNDRKIKEMVSGNFKAYNQTGKNNQNEQLNIEIELSEKQKISKDALVKISESIFKNLIKINTEFRKLHGSIGKRAMPKIKLIKNISSKITKNSKVLIGLKGKKPKILS